MFVLIAIIVIELGLLGVTVWPPRRRPVPARAKITRGSNDFPHAL